MAFGMVFLLWILWRAVRATASRRCRRRCSRRRRRRRARRAGSPTRSSAASLIVARRDVHQHADRHPRRHLPRRVRQGRLARAGDALHQRHPAVGAVDRDRPLRLHGLRAQVGHFSGWAGSFALALIAIPVVVRTTENMLQLVPGSLREAAVALGAPMWKVILMVTLRAVRGGVITGMLLAVARISGETAPLLFTALNNQFWSADMNAPMANLPVVIFQFAMSPFEDWKSLAWAGGAADHADGARHQHPRAHGVPAGGGPLTSRHGDPDGRSRRLDAAAARLRRRRCRRRRPRCRSATSTSSTASSRR